MEGPRLLSVTAKPQMLTEPVVLSDSLDYRLIWDRKPCSTAKELRSFDDSAMNEIFSLNKGGFDDIRSNCVFYVGVDRRRNCDEIAGNSVTSSASLTIPPAQCHCGMMG